MTDGEFFRILEMMDDFYIELAPFDLEESYFLGLEPYLDISVACAVVLGDDVSSFHNCNKKNQTVCVELVQHLP